ncbi:alpha-ketoglutarate-dependent taurine dioxygenase [Coprinopsis marcescibilis]|uniref:Alpha-ketoglutarate-dependent taurine dioxygenase n=1 Tax=Coprinopsis marcescibilis TaxID=230819 RepID=A0A5C3KY90_COPMA|nr:alpha-ketoglutarate-dependent taurine dioxygenase [Coprinopsis marcescibilis]
MAPSVAELQTQLAATSIDQAKAALNDKRLDLSAKYPPHSDVDEKLSLVEPFGCTDPGSRADKSLPNLIGDHAAVHHLSPYIGSELSGVQISQLSKEGLDELGLFAAQRKLLIFRDQDFHDLSPERQIEIARHFGPIHAHPTTPNIKGYPEFLNLVREPGPSNFFEYRLEAFNSHVFWHTDVSFEAQPPSATFFWLLDQPELGGDTLFLSTVEAYNRLSPEFKKRLEGLTALHSGVEQIEESRKRNGPTRREGVQSIHPVVRVHPVTGEKALYINPAFTRHIVGFKKEESDFLLKFLYDHIAKGADFQVRANYLPGTVVIWDNRVTNHTAVPDFSREKRRHALRLTPQGEVPIPATA